MRTSSEQVLIEVINRELNWFQNLEQVLPALPSECDTHLSIQQRARLNFYRGLINHTKLVGGAVDGAFLTDEGSEHLVAVSCWLPPDKRPSLLSLWRSGWMTSWWSFGLRGVYRMISYMLGLENLYANLTKGPRINHLHCGYLQIIGTHPAYGGNGFGVKLLKYQIAVHHKIFPEVPVLLDTSTGYGRKIYTSLGFVELGHKEYNLGTDDRGLRLSPDKYFKIKGDCSPSSTVMMLPVGSSSDAVEATA